MRAARRYRSMLTAFPRARGRAAPRSTTSPNLPDQPRPAKNRQTGHAQRAHQHRPDPGPRGRSSGAGHPAPPAASLSAKAAPVSDVPGGPRFCFRPALRRRRTGNRGPYVCAETATPSVGQVANLPLDPGFRLNRQVGNLPHADNAGVAGRQVRLNRQVGNLPHDGGSEVISPPRLTPKNKCNY